MKTVTFTILALLFTSISPLKDLSKIQMFEYTHPSHKEQVNYIRNISEYLMMKQQWDRKFDGNACPETSIMICPKGKTCVPPPPNPPTNVCDLPDHIVEDDRCVPTGSCADKGTCPIPLCEVDPDLRIDTGTEMERCEIDFCKLEENAESLLCQPVTKCDLKIYEDHLEECQTPAPPGEDKCKENPDLCVIICDVTGDYSECGTSICEEHPYLPGCNVHPPVEPCSSEVTSAVAPDDCCIGDGCVTAPDKCNWGYQIGERMMETVGEVESSVTTREDQQGNLFAECLNEIDVTYHQELSFQCFQEGISDGWTAIKKKKIDQMIKDTKKDGDKETRITSDDGKEISVNLVEDKTDELQF